jgi:hypothetical protein
MLFLNRAGAQGKIDRTEQIAEEKAYILGRGYERSVKYDQVNELRGWRNSRKRPKNIALFIPSLIFRYH